MPICLETKWLAIEEGEWRLHAKASQSIEEGTIVSANCSALSHKLHEAYASRHCAHCLLAPSKLFRCSSCKSAQYCGRNCQRKDFSQHKLECGFLKDSVNLGAGSQQDEEEICLLLRTHCTLKKANTKCKDDAGKLVCGVNHFQSMAQAANVCIPIETVETVAQYAPTLDVPLMLKIFQANNFGILNDLHETIGQGVYPHAALLNHSCDPNCLLRFNATGQLSIVAMRPIAKGEELTHSYVDLVSRTRRQDLQQLHGFSCHCRRCSGLVQVSLPRESPTDLYEWILQGGCKDEDTNTVTLPVDEVLDSYGESLSEATFEEGRRLMNHACLCMRDDDVNGELIALKRAVDTLQGAPLSRDLYQAHGMYLSALLLHISSQGREDLLPVARLTCKAMVAFLMVALPEKHPLIGLQLFTLGDLTQDIEIYMKARTVLILSHGKKHQLVQRLDDLLQCQKIG